MIPSLLRCLIELICIVVVYQLLVTVVDVQKLFRTQVEYGGRIRLLLLCFAIAIGYLVAAFFMDILSFSRMLTVYF